MKALALAVGFCTFMVLGAIHKAFGAECVPLEVLIQNDIPVRQLAPAATERALEVWRSLPFASQDQWDEIALADLPEGAGGYALAGTDGAVCRVMKFDAQDWFIFTKSIEGLKA
jgi:hypothetical protein